MLRAYVTHPVTSVESEYAARLRPDNKFEPGTKLFNGEADLGDILLDDADGTLDYLVALAGKRKIRITEDASGSEKTILVGRIASKEFERGHFRSARGRELTISIEDANADLRGIVVHKFVRPAETGRARVLATLSAYLNGSSSTALNPEGDPYGRASTVIGSAYVQNAGNVSMVAETYEGTDPLSVLRACAEWEKKRLGVYVNDDGTLDLYYAPIAETSQLNSTVSVSDNRADLGSLCFAPNWIAGPALHTDADDTLTGLLLIHPDGLSYDRRESQEAIRDRWEESAYSSLPVASGATELAAILDARQVEEPRRQFALRLPAAKIHLVKAGMRITVLRAVAAAIDSSTSLRIVNVRYAFLSPDDSENQYHVIVTLETPIKLGSSFSAASRPAPPPVIPQMYPAGQSATGIFELTVLLSADSISVVGYIAAGFEDGGGVQVLIDASTFPPFGTTLHWYLRDVLGTNYLGGEFTTGVNHTLTMGVGDLEAYARIGSDGVTAPLGAWPGATRIFVANNPGTNTDSHRLKVLNINSQMTTIDDFERTEAAGWGTASSGGGWSTLSGTPVWTVDGSKGTLRGSGASMVTLTVPNGNLGSGPGSYNPSLSQTVPWHFLTNGDDVSTAFAAEGSYLAGSLHVRVDNIPQTAIEDDPTTGDFSLSFAPASDEAIWISYQAGP